MQEGLQNLEFRPTAKLRCRLTVLHTLLGTEAIVLLRSERHTRTRAVYLDRVTRVDAASDFFGELHVPRRAITMGIATILEVRAESALLRIISKAVCDPVCIIRFRRLEMG